MFRLIVLKKFHFLSFFQIYKAKALEYNYFRQKS